MYLRQDEQRSELQKKIAAELQAKHKVEPPKGDEIDGVEDSVYVENMKQTTSLAWAWVLIVLATIGIIIWFIVIV